MNSALSEPTVTVNGQLLTEGEVITIRVALNSFRSDMQKPNAMGDDDHGRAMQEGYARCALATLVKMSNE